jgi:hypothetical protein
MFLNTVKTKTLELIVFEKEQILKNTETSLHVKPIHITDVAAPLSSGGLHDYYSNGDYWWPNPNTPDGLPFIKRDGETNPENFVEHRLLLRSLRTNVANLSAAYTVSGEEKYARKAVQLLKEFFLDEATMAIRQPVLWLKFGKSLETYSPV